MDNSINYISIEFSRGHKYLTTSVVLTDIEPYQNNLDWLEAEGKLYNTKNIVGIKETTVSETYIIAFRDGGATVIPKRVAQQINNFLLG